MAFTAEDFPILCETCLGENPYIRMTRERFGKACKICDRPFNVYRWKPQSNSESGQQARFKKTEICGMCAKLKNVCQTCILDLRFGVPVQVRDEALDNESKSLMDNFPVSRPNRNFMYEQLEMQQNINGINSKDGPFNANNDCTALLNRITAKSAPYYERNKTHICSFFVRGICNRGDACPYRHVDPSKINKDDKLKHQNIKDRFYGINDPVANKMLKKMNAKHSDNEEDESTNQNNKSVSNYDLPKPPKDTTVRTLFIGGIEWSMNEEHVRNKFGKFGVITTVNLKHGIKCGFVTFSDRESAENAMKKLFDKLVINDKKCNLNWVKTQNQNNNNNQNKHANDESNDQEKKNDNCSEKDPDLEINEKDKEFLKSQGILAPKLPDLPDNSANAYHPKRGFNYNSMDPHFKDAKF